jgi:hypothetical protein
VHLAEGNRHEGLRQYELCRRALAPLGLEPSPETETLRRRCTGGDGAVMATTRGRVDRLLHGTDTVTAA